MNRRRLARCAATSVAALAGGSVLAFLAVPAAFVGRLELERWAIRRQTRRG